MSRLVDVAKAARSLGIARHELQQLIRKGDLETFEGKVNLDDLQRLYPALAMPKQSLIEDTRILRDGAYARRIQSLMKPSLDDLETQVKRLKVQLSLAKVKANFNQKLVEDLVKLIGDLQQDCNPEQKDLLERLGDWLCRRFDDPKRSGNKKE